MRIGLLHPDATPHPIHKRLVRLTWAVLMVGAIAFGVFMLLNQGIGGPPVR